MVAQWRVKHRTAYARTDEGANGIFNLTAPMQRSDWAHFLDEVHIRTNRTVVMTPRQRKLVKDSFAKILPISDCVSTLFYIRLFELDPKLKQLFVRDMETQGRELMRFIAGIINSLDDFESAVPRIETLGKKHVLYGVKDHHYDTVRLALMWSLEQGLDSDLNDETKMAWNTVYDLVSGAMKAASTGMVA